MCFPVDKIRQIDDSTYVLSLDDPEVWTKWAMFARNTFKIDKTKKLLIIKLVKEKKGEF